MVSSEGLNKNTASLLTLEGAGFVKHPDGTQSPLWQGIKLGIGDIVVTSPGSKAVIVLADGSEFEFGKAQGDAVKIDTSVLDVVADVHEVRVLDLSYLYPLLNENQLDHLSANFNETEATLVVADGIDSGEFRDLLDGNPAPAYGGDLGGGDLTSGNRYVVLESNPFVYDTNPFQTNPIPEFSSDASQQFVAPESTPLALLMQSFSAASVIPEVPEVPVHAVPLHISLALDSAFSDPAGVDDDEPVTYHVSLNHAADSDITLNPVLILNGTAINLDPIIIHKGELSCDVNVRLPEEVDDTTAYYKLLLTVDTNLVGGIDVVLDESSPSDNNQTVVAVNTDLSVLSDYSSESYESAISVDWIGPPLGSSLDDELNYTGNLTVTVTDITLSQHITSNPILLDVYAKDQYGYISVAPLAVLTTSDQPLEGQIGSNFASGHSLSFDNVPLLFPEGVEGTIYTIFVVPHGLDPNLPPPADFFSSESVTSWNSLTLPVIADALQEDLSFTIDTDAVAAGTLIIDPHGQESQFTIHFNGELHSAITVEVTIDGQGTGNFVTFDPANVDPNVGFAIYDQFTGNYYFDFAIPDTEDGRTHAISLNLSTIDVVAAGFEEVSANLPSVAYAIYPDVEVTLGTFTVDDELGATATVSIDNLLAQDLVLQVHAVATDGSSFWDGTVTILAGNLSAELNVPLDETTEGKTFNVSLTYVYNYDGDIPTNQVYFATPSDLLSPDPINVDLSEVTNVAFTVPVDTVHITLTPDVTLINDEDPLASITFTYHIDQMILENQSVSFNAQIGGTSIDNVLIIDPSVPASIPQWDAVAGSWVGSFSISASLLPDGAQGLTLVPSDPVAATAAFGGMDDFVVDTVNLNVVDYSIISNDGINTYVFSEVDASDQGSSSGEPLHGADLIEGFDLIEGGVLQFEHAFVGATADFNLVNVSQESYINGLSVNDEGLVTFLNHDVAVEINQSNLAQAADFLVQHSTGVPGLTVDFLVNNGVGVDTYVFNQGEAHAGQPAYTLVNVSNQEAAGLSLGYTSSELIHIEHG